MSFCVSSEGVCRRSVDRIVVGFLRSHAAHAVFAACAQHRRLYVHSTRTMFVTMVMTHEVWCGRIYVGTA